jgi:uncharacterized protein YbjT (DUF2867 family)
VSERAAAVVAGATGLVGQALVRQLAADGAWREVRALARRDLPPRLAVPGVVPVQVDYSRLEPPPPWAAAEHVFCALGTTMRQAGSKEAFRRVDLDYPVALARATLARGARHFLLVSAVGASTASRFFYNRVKGEVEAAITGLGFRSVTIARPSLLLGDRGTFRWAEQVGRVAGVFAPRRWRPVSADSVAGALVAAARRDEPGVRILENPELRSGAA